MMEMVDAYLNDRRRVVDPADITPPLVADWRDDQYRAGAKPATIATRQRVILAFLRWAAEEGRTPHFLRRIRIGRVHKVQEAPKGLPVSQAERLLATAERESPKYAALISRLLLAGLRVSEALDLQPPYLVLRRDSSCWVEVQGKGQRTRRIPLPAWARDNLLAWEQDRSPLAQWMFPGGKVGRNWGPPMSRRSAAEGIERMARMAGIQDRVHPYALRHTFAHRWLAKGIDLAKIVDWMGHATIDTTRRYVRATAEESAEAMERGIEVLIGCLRPSQGSPKVVSSKYENKHTGRRQKTKEQGVSGSQTTVCENCPHENQ